MTPKHMLRKWLLIAYLLALHVSTGLMLWKSDFLLKVHATLGSFSETISGAADKRNALAANTYLDRLDRTLRSERPLVLLGDSIPRDLPVDMRFAHSLNLGLGGLKMTDLGRIASRLPALPASRAIVLSIGINDLCLDLADAAEFARRLPGVAAALPRNVPVYWLSLTPTAPNAYGAKCAVSANAILSANLAIATACAQLSTCHYVDTHSAVADRNGRLRQDCDAGDGLHLSRVGYQRWREAIANRLDAGPSLPPVTQTQASPS